MTKKTNKKKKGTAAPMKISPERYIRERARKLPSEHAISIPDGKRTVLPRL